MGFYELKGYSTIDIDHVEDFLIAEVVSPALTKTVAIRMYYEEADSQIADALSDARYLVSIFDNRESPYLRDDQKIIVGDILNAVQVKEAVKWVDVVYHLAALSDMDDAQNRPFDTMQINVIGNTILLDAVREFNI